MGKGLKSITYILISIFICNICFSQTHVQNTPSEQDKNCQEFLDWVVKEFTVQNLEKSYERVTNKLLLAFFTLYKETNRSTFRQMSKKKEFTKLASELKKLDPDFEKYLRSHKPYKFYSRFMNLPNFQKNLLSVVKTWKDLQSSHPLYFDQLDKKYHLDDYDLATSKLLDQVDQIDHSGLLDHARLKALKDNFLTPDEIIKTPSIDIVNYQEQLKKLIEQGQIDILKSGNKILSNELEEYQDLCNLNQVNDFLSRNNISCPILNETNDFLLIQENLNQLSEAIDVNSLSLISKPSVPDVSDSNSSPVPILTEDDIINENLRSNSGAIRCKRSPEIVDTVILHHTATPNYQSRVVGPESNPRLEPILDPNGNKILYTPKVINKKHLDNVSNHTDRWMMLGYHYLINGEYDPNSSAPPKIYSGRPNDIQGAHAGGFTGEESSQTKLSAETKKRIIDLGVECGPEGNLSPMDEREIFPNRTPRGRRTSGQVNANLTSVGVAIIGTYAPKFTYSSDLDRYVPTNSFGYNPGNKRYPTPQTIESVAKLICHLKTTDFPNLKYIRPHKMYKAGGTACPGTVSEKINDIIIKIKEIDERCQEFQQ